MTTSKRKICFIITSKIHHARSRLILKDLRRIPHVTLQVVVGGSAILSRYGDVEVLLARDRFPISARITMVLEGGSTVAMAKTAGLGMSEFATVFENLNPDVVVVRGDRYEVLAAAAAAAYMNKTIAHIEGGDVTGSIDESVRHAVTKFAHIHFTTNEDSRQRVIRMGEDPRFVFNVGSPDVEVAAQHRAVITTAMLNQKGVGAPIDVSKPYLVVLQHPVTTEVEGNEPHMRETLRAISALNLPTVVFWPNIDAGGEEVSHAIRLFKEYELSDKRVRFVKYLDSDQFLALIRQSVCLIGNSSCGIKECSYFGVPVVNIGSRQERRLRGKNVVDVPYDATDIAAAVKRQLRAGRRPRSTVYYKPHTSRRIAAILATTPLYIQKRFVDAAPYSRARR